MASKSRVQPRIITLAAFRRMKGRVPTGTAIYFNKSQWRNLLRSAGPSRRLASPASGGLMLSEIEGIDGGFVVPDPCAPGCKPVTGYREEGSLECDCGVPIPKPNGNTGGIQFGCYTVSSASGSASCKGRCEPGSRKRCKLQRVYWREPGHRIGTRLLCRCAT
jgi:hypothetical protein